MTPVDKLHEEFQALILFLDNSSEVSFRITVDANFRKSLLLAAASYFEDKVIEHIESFINENSQQNKLIISFVQKKALSRQYHTLFNWDGTNANQFFSLFGIQFKNFMQAELQKEPNLERSVKAFLEIGRERNRLVHQNYATYSIEKTAHEIYELYKCALKFVENISSHLSICARNIDDNLDVNRNNK